MVKNFRNTVRRLIREWVRNNVETTLPGVVIDISTYQDTQQIAVVQPLLNLVFEDNQAVEMPYLYNVPVELLGTQESVFSVPIKVGDTVKLSFSKRSLDTLKEQAEAVAHNPDDTAWFDTKDAVAFPTVLNKPVNLNPHPDHVEIKHRDILVSYQDDGSVITTTGDSTFQILPDGTIEGSNPNGEFTLQVGGDMLINGCTINTLGNVITNNGTDLDAFKAAYDIHVHAHGTPNTSGPMAPPPPPP